MSQGLEKIGIVVIGRNEGERLKRCLRSLQGRSQVQVYVDSGSTDGSGEFARSMGVDVVDLDMSVPFTMARGRNAGVERVLELHPEVEYIQFVDGDCEVVEGWIEKALVTLEEKPEIAVVFGRRRERFPENSIYNRLIDIEWAVPPGEVDCCGGDTLMRVKAFEEAGRFDPTMIAGEEPELSVRLRKKDWKILCIDQEMTLHDAALLRYEQWWKRAVRGGHAYAEGAARHGEAPYRHHVREVRSILFWAGAFPLIVLGLTLGFMNPWILLAFLAYPLQILRVTKYRLSIGDSFGIGFAYSFFCIMDKFPQLLGVLKYWSNRLRGKKSLIMEYKDAPSPSDGGADDAVVEPEPVTDNEKS